MPNMVHSFNLITITLTRYNNSKQNYDTLQTNYTREVDADVFTDDPRFKRLSFTKVLAAYALERGGAWSIKS